MARPSRRASCWRRVCSVSGVPRVVDDAMSSPDGIRRPEADHRGRAEPVLRDDLVEHRVRILVERTRRFAELLVVEDRGELAGQLPGLEERRPVDVVDQLGERIILEHARAEEGRLRRTVIRPVERRARSCAHPSASSRRLFSSPRACAAAILAYSSRTSSHIGAAHLLRHQLRHHADRAARVGDVARSARAGSSDGSSPPCARGWSSRRRSAAAASKPSRSISAATWHISSSDGVIRPDRPMMSAFSSRRGLQDLRRRHHHAEVDHLVVVALEHDADDVLADVVHVALHGRHHDLAGGLLRGLAVAFFSSSMNGSR